MNYLNISTNWFSRLGKWASSHTLSLIILASSLISIASFLYYSQSGLNLAYNDSRSHLDIGRRVVEGLKPGLAQLGSVWLPLPHLLMIPTIWNDFFWHTGLSGSIQSMVSYVATAALVYLFLSRLRVGLVGRLIAVIIFCLNPNILYLQSTAMTELLLLATMTTGCYFLLVWHETDALIDLIKAGFFIMLSTLVRYDGWFLLIVACALIFLRKHFQKGWSTAEGTSILFGTLAGFGIILWFGWNLLIFKDPLYFAFGPYSAHTQQAHLEKDSLLQSKGHIVNSTATYLLALTYNSTTILSLLGLIGVCFLALDRKISTQERIASTTLMAPLAFNILALVLGHSVLFVPELSGTWFNIRYGVMMVPSIAVFTGYLIDRLKSLRPILIGSILFTVTLSVIGNDAVTLDDGLYGGSQINIVEAVDYLKSHALHEKGFILISEASHDPLIFSSGLPMKRFINEGTGVYWISATAAPDRWARWIVMRTDDAYDNTWKLLANNKALSKYNRLARYGYADIYEIKPEYLSQLNYEPIYSKQR